MGTDNSFHKRKERSAQDIKRRRGIRKPYDRILIVEVLREPRRIAIPLKATSVRLDDETLTRVGQMAEAIKQYVAREEWFIREVEKGVKAADEGCLIDHMDIKAKWEAKRATQMD